MKLSDVRYRVIAFPPSGSGKDISNLLMQAKHEEMDGELASKFSATMQNVKFDTWAHHFVKINNKLLIQANTGNGWKEVYRGTVFKYSTHTSDDKTVSFTAYDDLYYLQMSSDHLLFSKGETGASSIRRLVRDWSIPIKTIDGPNVQLAKKVYRGIKLGQVIQDRLSDSEKMGGGKFVIRSDQGKLCCIQAGANTTVYEFTESTPVSSDDEYSIENIVTRVKIYGNEDEGGRAPIEATRDGKTEYGIFQDIIYSSSFDSLSEARKAAAEIIKHDGGMQRSPRINVPNVPWVRKGDRVVIKIGTISGEFIVESIVRNIIDLTMSLRVRRSS
ncbi:hypothetical protein ACERJO_11790 [Halalkalibacter sp. AB-rgal2]|uniref:XkdQ/YqbQ family protein n=1 Tax=Halalkalibacter sp. AB-rgal2 TaxID=3242695 RepID=UPI00359E4D41